MREITKFKFRLPRLEINHMGEMGPFKEYVLYSDHVASLSGQSERVEQLEKALQRANEFVYMVAEPSSERKSIFEAREVNRLCVAALAALPEGDKP